MNLDIKLELRPCIVKTDDGEKRALFHSWCDNAHTRTAILVGETSGQFWRVYGLVELEDGSVEMHEPYSIRFLDSKGRFDEAFMWIHRYESLLSTMEE